MGPLLDLGSIREGCLKSELIHQLAACDQVHKYFPRLPRTAPFSMCYVCITSFDVHKPPGCKFTCTLKVGKLNHREER